MVNQFKYRSLHKQLLRTDHTMMDLPFEFATQTINKTKKNTTIVQTNFSGQMVFSLTTSDWLLLVKSLPCNFRKTPETIFLFGIWIRCCYCYVYDYHTYRYTDFKQPPELLAYAEKNLTFFLYRNLCVANDGLEFV